MANVLHKKMHAMLQVVKNVKNISQEFVIHAHQGTHLTTSHHYVTKSLNVKLKIVHDVLLMTQIDVKNVHNKDMSFHKFNPNVFLHVQLMVAKVVIWLITLIRIM